MSDTIRIITNNVPRNLIYGYELGTEEMQEFIRVREFDYLTADDFQTHEFFRYKGRVYDPSEFMTLTHNHPFPKCWHGYSSDSFFSGILIRYTSDNEQVIVGTYFS